MKKIYGIDYANKEIFTISKPYEEKFRPITSRDFIRRSYTEIWCQYPRYIESNYPNNFKGIAWSAIRDQHFRCFPFPKDLYIPGKAARRGHLYVYRNDSELIPQYTSAGWLGYSSSYNVTGISGSFGSPENRLAFYSTEIGSDIPDFDLSSGNEEDYEVVFITGDMAGIRRKIHQYDSSDGYIRVSHYKYKGIFPGWNGRGIKVGDKFRLIAKGGNSSSGAWNWHLTSRVYKGGNPHSLNLYKSIRFNGGYNYIGNPSYSITMNDEDRIKIVWKEIQYNWVPRIQRIMPSDIFPSAGISRRKATWPAFPTSLSNVSGSIQSWGLISSFTRVYLGNYMIPTFKSHYSGPSVPVYVWDITYQNGLTKRYEYPFLYTIVNLPPGFDVEMWTITKRKKLMPRNAVGNVGGGNHVFTQYGDFIYFNQERMMYWEPDSNHGWPQVNQPIWLRARNPKNGGFTPLTHEHIILKHLRRLTTTSTDVALDVPIIEY